MISREMSLLFLIALIALCWLAYSVLRTQRKMEAELREIRKKCVGGSGVPAETTDVLQATSVKVTEGLQKLLALTI